MLKELGSERWLPIAETGGRYAVSDLGRVRSPRGVMKGSPATNGYLRIGIRFSGRQRFFHVHSLVAAAFIGPRPAGYDVDHIDHDRLNNSLENLRYLTMAENRAGRVTKGNARLTEAQVREILALQGPDRIGLAAIGARYGVGKVTIHDIFAGKKWKHLSSPPFRRDTACGKGGEA